MDARTFIESEIKRLVTTARALTGPAEDENRDLSAEEKAQVESAMSQIGAFKTRLAEVIEREELSKRITELAAPGVEGSKAAPEKRSVGEAFVKSDAYVALKQYGFKGDWRTGPVEFERDVWSGKVQDGAGVEVVGIGDVGGILPIQPQFIGARGPVENVLTIENLLGQGTATQNTIIFLEENVTTPGVLSERYSDSDATVSLTTEASLKPAANIDWVRRQKTLSKLAAFMPISDEMMEDEPQLASYINTRLALFIRQATDAFIIDEIEAAAATATASEIGQAGNWFDAIASGIQSAQSESSLNPDAVLMNPRDFWTMSVSKATGTGEYFQGSPYASVNNNPWGVRVLVSNAITQGTAIVGAFQEGATLWSKGGVSLEASNSHSDYFRRNLTALRAERRVAVTVFRPAAFQRVTRS